MSDKRRGLGRGIGALIPTAPPGQPPAGRRDRPVDVFFPAGPGGKPDDAGRPADTATDVTSSGDADEVAPAAADAVTADGPASDTASDTASDNASDTASDTASDSGPRSTDIGSDAPDDDRSAAEDAATPASDAVSRETAAAADGTTGDETDDSGGGLVAVPGARFAELPVRAIRPNARQPRQVFEQDAMSELVHSVREVGVLQPVVVRPLPEPDADGASYELIMGERRWRASAEAGLEVVPAIVRETGDDDMLRDALLENLHRSELNPLEEAAAYQQLLDDFGCTQDELSRRIGRSRPQISNTMRLLRLPPAVQRRVAAGVLSAGHARALLALEDDGAAERLAHRIVTEGLSVRAVEEIVSTQGTAPSRTRAPRAGRHLPLLDDVATRLSDRLDTRVKVALGRHRGRLTVEFASVDDLERILSVLDPGGPGVSRVPAGAGPADDAGSEEA